MNRRLATTALAGLMAWSASAQNLVTNGGFESPVVPSSPGYVNYAAGSTGITGWTVDTTPADGVSLQKLNAFGPSSGSQSVQLTGATAYSAGGGVRQTITTTPGTTYEISIGLGSRSAAGAKGWFNFGGVLTPLTGPVANAWTTTNWQVTATSSSTLIDVFGTNGAGSAQLIIDNVSVTTLSPPTLTTQPASSTNYAGNTARFSVAAIGPAPLSYQWHFNTNTALPAGTNATLVLPNAQDAGTYGVIITNAYGAVTSSVATLTLLPNLTINGDFEADAPATHAAGTALTGWSVDVTPGDGVDNHPASYFGNTQVPNTQVIQLCGASTYTFGGGMSQTIATTPGTTYLVSIDVANRQNGTTTGNLDFGGQSYALTASSKTFSTLTWEITASGASTVIDITGSTSSGSSQLMIDNVRVTPVSLPAITAEPQSRTNYAGTAASFTVAGTGATSYQWYFNTNTAITDATSAILAFANVQPIDAGTYSVVLSNIAGAVTSSIVTLTVLPNLTVNPDFESPVVSSYATYTAGSAGLTGWTVDFTPPDGATLGRKGAFGTSNDTQFVQLCGAPGYTTGGGISQTIATEPGYIYNVSIDVAARSATPASGTFYFGSQSQSLTASSLTTFQTLTFQFTATDASTVIDITGDPTSGAHQLFVDNVFVVQGVGSPPSITGEPQSRTNAVGTTASFSVTAGGLAPLSYQWYYNTSTPLPAGTNATLTLANVQGSDAGTYSVIVTNSVNSATSSVVTLTVVTNLTVQNWDFELPNFNANFPAGDAGGLPGWIVDTAPDDGVRVGTAGFFNGSITNNSSRFLALSGGPGDIFVNGGGIHQTIGTTPGATYTISLDVAARSSAPATGNLSFGGQTFSLTALSLTDFTNLTFSAVASNSLTVIDITGDPFSSSQQLLIDNLQVVLQPTVNTEPTNITAVVNGSSLDLSWPSDHIGWTLQVQTNQLNAGLGTNWFAWPGSDTTNAVSIPLNLAPTVFMRLVYP